MKEAVISGVNLTLGYLKGDVRKEVLKALSFELYPGQMTCLMGPNGVGKTTLVKAILGRLPIWEGRLKIKGKSISKLSPKELSKQLSVVLTEPIIPGNMTVGQLVSLGRTPYLNWSGYLSDFDKKVVKEALVSTNLLELKDERLSEISDGQKQKTMIARALAQDSPIMILDEPTAHLDLVNRFEIMQLLHEIAITQNKGILVITHDLDIALETSDKLWLLRKEGGLITGLTEDLILTKKIDQLFPQKNILFNVERGKVELQRPSLQLNIEGDDAANFWISKALKKAGVSSPKGKIIVFDNPFSIQYEGLEFKSIHEFMAYLSLDN